VYFVQKPGFLGSNREPVNVIQYWFFYAYNYYPVVLIGDQDRHQGDWESVTVVVRKATGSPRPCDSRRISTPIARTTSAS
jgi:hypothetical protein